MNWYALRATPRGEFRADEELEQAGIERFTPFYRVRTLIRHTKARVRVVDRPLMCGYLFAKLDFGPHSHHPTALDGCKYVVDTVNTISGKPIPLREKVLLDLRRDCESGKYDQGRERGQDDRFMDGDAVRIVEGTWAGFVMKFRATAEGTPKPRMGYVRLAMDRLFGCDGFELDVPQELIEAA